jgi:transcriptional regulator with XRE-family HTH domain
MSIGDRIRDRLKATGLTQADLVRRSGVKQSTLSSILQRGARSTPHLLNLATALQTTPAYLLGETDDPESETADESFSVEERELVGLIRKLSRQDFEAMAQLLRTLARVGPGPDYRAVQEVRTAKTLHDRQLGYNAG